MQYYKSYGKNFKNLYKTIKTVNCFDDLMINWESLPKKLRTFSLIMKSHKTTESYKYFGCVSSVPQLIVWILYKTSGIF